MTPDDYDFGVVISVPHNVCVHLGMELKETVQLLLSVTSSFSVRILLLRPWKFCNWEEKSTWDA